MVDHKCDYKFLFRRNQGEYLVFICQTCMVPCFIHEYTWLVSWTLADTEGFLKKVAMKRSGIDIVNWYSRFDISTHTG